MENLVDEQMVMDEQIATILCCSCGIPILHNPAAMCIDCLKTSTDITEGIPREAVLNFCRSCERFLSPPSQWVNAQPESRELLALCLRKLRGLNKAWFIWTEPHSRRVRVKLTIQKEAFVSTILQQSFEVEYVVTNQQCLDCAKLHAKNTWKASVQIRQKVQHKRTFLYLEQLILKHNAHRDCNNIVEVKDGLDFFYPSRNGAIKMVDFLNNVVPVRTKKSEELISMDVHTSTNTYKFTWSVELIPICKDDLVCLSGKLAKSLGNISQLLLCSRVGNSIHLIDPLTLRTTDVACPVYWRTPFCTLADIHELVEFTVLDVELLGQTHGRLALADVEIAKSSDLGVNDQQYTVRTHLGAILKPGDTARGYHLTTTNFNDPEYESLDQSLLPDIILVKKSYPNRRKKNKTRNWKLRTLSKEQTEMNPRKQDIEKQERDYEEFLRDLEEDTEMRSMVNVYKHKDRPTKMEGLDEGIVGEDEDDADFPEIPIEELLDEMHEMKLE
ncbi:60S ribosomal export protein NMD3 [Neolecta irregularis DAH-3]|uniref:60S ribosomal export protein NMD3 n=1 Tax=Neolecta irregularis (strain DAH-3) TaxID=1198029 RepID=A0A1U7LIQ5_NEOID|nr:60S ribosomal export protein NMD3 [Neolecta irregularis DAH-3]|eukprot:OLL22432.1 60S ribosomal export protein NMD3 [Neolecta irregularis DAH-3]